MNSNSLKIAVIEGDGIGKEVVPEGLRVLEAASRRFDISFKAAAAIVSAIETVLAQPDLRTRDMGGSADTVTGGGAIAEAVAH